MDGSRSERVGIYGVGMVVRLVVVFWVTLVVVWECAFGKEG